MLSAETVLSGFGRSPARMLIKPQHHDSAHCRRGDTCKNGGRQNFTTICTRMMGIDSGYTEILLADRPVRRTWEKILYSLQTVSEQEVSKIWMPLDIGIQEQKNISVQDQKAIHLHEACRVGNSCIWAPILHWIISVDRVTDRRIDIQFASTELVQFCDKGYIFMLHTCGFLGRQIYSICNV